ncbi:FixH family protein [Micromonospora sp. MP36]|uniref:FixH family protein n=2 Tax=unclassified Micromonospora TaxID=2617518 RepID=UPI001CA37696|nr:FixH family protein [Micromonospora sp. MP36]
MILGICLGMTVALMIGALGFLLTRPTAVADVSAGQAEKKGAGQPAAGQEQPAASIDVTAQHIGDLQVRIEAKVTAPGSYDPITKGQVFAYTDMVAMPLSHKKGPIVMAEVAGRPGTYQAVTQVPMIGEYNVTVEVRQPMASRADKRVDVQGVTKS